MYWLPKFIDLKLFAIFVQLFKGLIQFYQFYSGYSSVLQAVRFETEDQDLDSVQQPVALKIDPSVQQAVRLSAVLASVPWGHHVLLINMTIPTMLTPC